jgi:predicted aspartyl protease
LRRRRQPLKHAAGKEKAMGDRGGVRRSWRLGAVLAMILGASAQGVRAADAPCQLQKVAELPVMVYDGMPTVDVQINGQPARLLVDTGSDNTLLYRSGAAQLRLDLRRLVDARPSGAESSDEAQLARVNSLVIGGATVLKDEDLVVVERGDMGPIEGVLGARFLDQFDVEFDIPDGKIRFFRAKGCAGDQVVYWGAAYAVTPLRATTSHGLYIDAVVNGVPIDTRLDSGASSSLLTPEGAVRAGASGARDVDTFQSFAFGEETIRNAKLRVADRLRADGEISLDSRIATAAKDEPQMLLGADFFRSHRIYVALEQKKVYASYVGGPVFAPVSAAAPTK